jgi:hypothetical protein
LVVLCVGSCPAGYAVLHASFLHQKYGNITLCLHVLLLLLLAVAG